MNREANDDHMEVVAWIADRGVLPEREDCWECVQPQLYHATCALWIRGLGIAEPDARTVASQLVSAAAGILTLVLFLRFFRRLELPPLVALAGFALVAFNPRLTAINGQATNDSFVILFGNGSLYCLWRWLQTRRVRYGAALVASVCLAGLSKGNGLVVFAAVLAVLVLHGLSSREQRPRQALAAAALVTAFLATVPFLGPYYAHYRSHGSFLAVHTPKSPPPPLWRETRAQRPGITSVVHGYLTFRLLDLLEQPYIEVRGPTFPAHRTSLWSQVYGRAHFSRFVQWPPSWRRTDAVAVALGRGLLVLGLAPLALLALGAARSSARQVGRALPALRAGRLPRSVLCDPDAVFGVAGLAFVAFLVKYTYDYRDLAYMKAIFLYPALLCAARYFAEGSTWLWDRWGTRRPFALAYAGVLGALCALYVADVALLIADLARLR